MNYYRLMLGRGSQYASQAQAGGFVGIYSEIDSDLSQKLYDDWRDFNHEFIPIYLERHPDKTKIAAGLACGALWTVICEIQVGDIVLCPDGQGKGEYLVGRVISGYNYQTGQPLPHYRKVEWLSNKIKREDMSIALKNSAGSVGTISRLSKYAEELQKLLQGSSMPEMALEGEIVEDPATFQLEKQLETFLVDNWSNTALGQKYNILTDEDGSLIGQQFKTDSGPLDILAIKKDKSELLVVELKRGRASDRVIGQIQRYMGYVKKELAEPHQQVKGAIIALQDDPKLQLALLVAPNIGFYTYQISFKLNNAGGEML